MATVQFSINVTILLLLTTVMLICMLIFMATISTFVKYPDCSCAHFNTRSSKILSQCTFIGCYQERCAPAATDANLATCT